MILKTFEEHLLLERKASQSCQNWYLRIFGKFWRKIFFEKLHKVSTFSGLWVKKSNFSQTISFRVVTTAIRASREIFWENFVSLSKFFLLSSLEIEQFLCCFAKFNSQVCHNNYLCVERKNWKKLTRKNLFLNQFRNLSKTGRHDLQNCNLCA